MLHTIIHPVRILVFTIWDNFGWSHVDIGLLSKFNFSPPSFFDAVSCFATPILRNFQEWNSLTTCLNLKCNNNSQAVGKISKDVENFHREPHCRKSTCDPDKPVVLHTHQRTITLTAYILRVVTHNIYPTIQLWCWN